MDLQDVVDDVSRLLGAAATLEDRGFRLLAFGSHEGEADDVRRATVLRRGSGPEVRAWFEQFGIATATGPLRTPASPALGVTARICLPVRADGVTYGYLWVPDLGQDDALVAGATGPADLAGTLLARAARSARRLEERVLAVLGDDGAEAERAAADLEASGRLERGVPVRAVVLDGPVPAGLPGGTVRAEVDGRAVLLVHRLDVVARVLGSGAPAGSVAGGSGAGGAGSALPAAEASTSFEQARVALTVARHVPAAGPLAVWDDLGPYRLLAAAAPSALRGAVLDDPVRRLLADPVLRTTAAVWLDAGGSVARTAATLHVHRQTLYHRLGRVEALTGLDLADGRDRLRLHLGLTLAVVLDP